MSAFYWVAKARLFRSKTLSEARRDYVSASKTMGTSDFKIMFREIMPNLSSLIITNLTMNFAANIGIETTLTFLGFGLPANVPSLGTLIGYASNGEVLVNRQWIWLPASILILVLMLSINYVGQAFKRSADARQRLASYRSEGGNRNEENDFWICNADVCCRSCSMRGRRYRYFWK